MLEDLGNIGDFLGGIGVVVTLAYLAVQIRKNTRSIRSAALDSISTSVSEFMDKVAQDPVLTKLWFDGLSGTIELSETDNRRFNLIGVTKSLGCAKPDLSRASHRTPPLRTRQSPRKRRRGFAPTKPVRREPRIRRRGSRAFQTRMPIRACRLGSDEMRSPIDVPMK